MPEKAIIAIAINNLKPGDPISVYEEYGQGYRHTLVESVDQFYITVKSDSSWVFHKDTGRCRGGTDRRLCPTFQAKYEEQLFELIDGTAFVLSVEQFEECKAAITKIKKEYQ